MSSTHEMASVVLKEYLYLQNIFVSGANVFNFNSTVVFDVKVMPMYVMVINIALFRLVYLPLNMRQR